MAIVAFVNQKGGCGKSTLAVHFAHWAIAQQGRRGILVDADPQGSSSFWLAQIEAEIPVICLTDADELLAKLPQLASQYEWVVVDGPASLAKPAQAVLLRADVAIVPVQPSGVDLRSAASAMQVIDKIAAKRDGLPRSAVVLNRAVRGTRLKEEAIALLGESPNMNLLHTVLHQRQAIADTSGQGATIWDLLGTAARDAAAEFNDLCAEISALVMNPG